MKHMKDMLITSQQLARPTLARSRSQLEIIKPSVRLAAHTHSYKGLERRGGDRPPERMRLGNLVTEFMTSILVQPTEMLLPRDGMAPFPSNLFFPIDP